MRTKLHDIWPRIIGIPALAVVGTTIGSYQKVVISESPSERQFFFYFRDIGSYFFVVLFFVFLIWHVNRYIHCKLRKHYEQFDNKKKFIRGWMVRLVFYGLTTCILVFVANLLLNYNAGSTVFLYRFAKTVSFALLSSYLVAGFYETRYFIYEWGKSYSEAQDLKRLHLQTQIDSLKNQINPHFLFNSLNTLSSLVSSDTVKAEKFIDEMSSIYRYLLQNNEKDLITLNDEMTFVHSFFHLLKTRYGDAINVFISIKPFYLDYLLPPLTLQLLIENAVKHNVVSTSRPLQIKIYTDEFAQLLIENNVQAKTSSVKSNKVGLANIFAKYRLLNQAPVVANHTESMFQVILPLILPSPVPVSPDKNSLF